MPRINYPKMDLTRFPTQEELEDFVATNSSGDIGWRGDIGLTRKYIRVWYNRVKKHQDVQKSKPIQNIKYDSDPFGWFSITTSSK